jgi:hypothetical protein
MLYCASAMLSFSIYISVAVKLLIFAVRMVCNTAIFSASCVAHILTVVKCIPLQMMMMSVRPTIPNLLPPPVPEFYQ